MGDFAGVRPANTVARLKKVGPIDAFAMRTHGPSGHRIVFDQLVSGRLIRELLSENRGNSTFPLPPFYGEGVTVNGCAG